MTKAAPEPTLASVVLSTGEEVTADVFTPDQRRRIASMAVTALEEPLDENQQTVFERLRQWRRDRAKTDGIAQAYLIATDRVRRRIARTMPAGPFDLLRIEGIGKGKTLEYGEEILSVLDECREGADAHRGS